MTGIVLAVRRCMHRITQPRIAAVAGIVGPLLLGGVIATLTVVQYDFLRGLRWHPLRAPTTDWPSGLALGPYGWVMVTTFVVSGLLLAVFAGGLRRSLAPQPGPRLGTTLLLVAATAVMLLGFRTDPTYRTTPGTFHGAIHDGAFVLLGVSLLPALFVLWHCFRRDQRWRGHATYTLVTALLIVPAFVLKGLAFYLFLGGVLAWFVVTALRLRQVAA